MKKYLLLSFLLASLCTAHSLKADTIRWEEYIKKPSSNSKYAALNRDDFYSQSFQDQFVYWILYGVLEKQDAGSYVEFGAAAPVFENKTYFFEKNFSWKGLSFGIFTDFTTRWQETRANPFLLQDITQADYRDFFSPFSNEFDYLSLDIDTNCVEVLKRIPFDAYKFKVITIKHDSYRVGNIYKDEERQILQDAGYHLLCGNVLNEGNPFEDWWIHPSFFSAKDLDWLSSLSLHDKDGKEVVKILKKALLSRK